MKYKLAILSGLIFSALVVGSNEASAATEADDMICMTDTGETRFIIIDYALYSESGCGGLNDETFHNVGYAFKDNCASDKPFPKVICGAEGVTVISIDSVECLTYGWSRYSFGTWVDRGCSVTASNLGYNT